MSKSKINNPLKISLNVNSNENNIYNKDCLLKDLSDLNVPYNSQKINKMFSFLEILYHEKSKHNLIGTKNKEDILVRHFYDCLSIFKFFNNRNLTAEKIYKILDVGTGAGLPGILLSIFMENSKVYLLDSKLKNINFLFYVKENLNLNNILIINDRAELLSHNQNFRENFDFVVCRALASVRVVSEMLIPFCKINGYIIIYKSKKIYDEIKEASNTIKLLGAKLEDIFEVSVPKLNEFRVLLILKKESNTLFKYPRIYAKIIKKPLT